MANEAVKHCDELLLVEDCFNGPSRFEDTSDQPAIPIPLEPLGGDKLLKVITIGCKSVTDEFRRCSARPFVRWRDFRIQVPIDCAWKVSWTAGKLDKDKHGNATQLTQPTRPECKGPWVDVNVRRITPHGNFLYLGAIFAAPEATAPGGPVHHLWTIEDKRDHDARLLCGDDGWERCLAPDVDPQNCLKLGLKSEEGPGLMKALAAQADPPQRSELAQKFLGRIYYQNSCSLPRQLRDDPREKWRLKTEEANRRGPPRVIFDVRADGALTEERVQATLSPALPSVTKCFDEARERLKNWRVGYIATNMKVTPAGAVAAVDGGAMNNPKKDAQLYPCVAEVFRSLKFPRRPSASVIYVVTTDMPQ